MKIHYSGLMILLTGWIVLSFLVTFYNGERLDLIDRCEELQIENENLARKRDTCIDAFSRLADTKCPDH